MSGGRFTIVLSRNILFTVLTIPVQAEAGEAHGPAPRGDGEPAVGQGQDRSRGRLLALCSEDGRVPDVDSLLACADRGVLEISDRLRDTHLYILSRR